VKSKKPYFEKLKDPRWQRKRLEILSRDDFQCQNCKSREKTLNVHHIFYANGKDPWDISNHALVTLCEECHLERSSAQDQLLLSTGKFSNEQLMQLSSFIGLFFDFNQLRR